MMRTDDDARTGGMTKIMMKSDEGEWGGMMKMRSMRSIIYTL